MIAGGDPEDADRDFVLGQIAGGLGIAIHEVLPGPVTMRIFMLERSSEAV